jgi:hypothetical protein
MIFTKKVTVTYASAKEQHGSPEHPFTSARWNKMQELLLAEKTDGKVVVIPPTNTSIINFVDQSSATEYLNYILEAATAAGDVSIVSSSITDI